MKTPALPFVAAIFAALTPAIARQDASDTTPGVTLRVYRVEGAVHNVPTLADGQTPNLDQLHPDINFQGPDFGDLPPPILTMVTAELIAPHAGPYRFRLTSDDGSRLFIRDQLVIDNDGRHGTQAIASERISMAAGAHPIFIDHFDHIGDRVLKLEWQPPGQADFTLVPPEALRTDNDLTRVTSPGIKTIDDGRRPGDRKPLEGVHPGWNLTTIRPDGFEPMVGAMAFVPGKEGDRLIVGTFHPLQRDDRSLPDIDSKQPDVLHALTNVTSGDPDHQIEVTICAEGFYEPTGLCAVGDDLYVAQRKEITRLRDHDGDGYYETHDTIAAGWEGWNYHQFAFGLIERDGLLYTALSTAMAPDGWEGMGTNAAPNGPLRGSILQIDPSIEGRHSFRVFAGGTRTPNGLALGPDNALFYFDNQGTWMPTSVMAEVIDGRFYGHYNRTNLVPMLAERFPEGGHPSDFADRLRTPAAVYLPQNEVCNSPTQAQLIPEGLFAGQMFMGELTGGGIRRIFLENVNGQWQGAIFRFTQGLEAGVNRLEWGPDGALYAGGIGALGNWNWKNTKFGLQRLEPNGKTVFEMHSVRATPDGFIITFTKPVDREWLAEPGNYTIRQWRYHPTIHYGGPKVDEEMLRVRSAISTDDGLSVHLRIDGLREGRCVYIHTDPVSTDGEQIWSTEAWYTLNAVPRLEPPTPATLAGKPVDIDTGLGVGILPPAHGVPLVSGAAAPAFKRSATNEFINAAPLTQDDFTNPDAPQYIEAHESGGDLVTTTVLADCRLHVEWYCPPGGEGQMAANSGVYLQDKYEIQILGTPAPGPSTEPPAVNEAGAIYTLRAADVNASTGPGTWQAYDIYFRAPRFKDGAKTEDARLTLYWNGALVHNDVAIPHPTGSRKARGESAAAGGTSPQVGPLILQAHASSAEGPVRFRNVWIAPLDHQETQPGPWIDLLQPSPSPESSDGSPLAGWTVRGGEATFQLVKAPDGSSDEIVGVGRPGTPNTFLITERTFRDFELLAEIKQPVVEGAHLNSGIQIRSHVQDGMANRAGPVQGYQVELDPGERAWTAGLYEERRRGWLHPLSAAPYARRAHRPDDWNTIRVVCQGEVIRTWLNGVPAAAAFDALTPEGHIALQVHSVPEGQEGLEVRLRNLRVRELHQ